MFEEKKENFGGCQIKAVRVAPVTLVRETEPGDPNGEALEVLFPSGNSGEGRHEVLCAENQSGRGIEPTPQLSLLGASTETFQDFGDFRSCPPQTGSPSGENPAVALQGLTR